jgi:cell wall-associated NlpC family hydrolase
VIAAANLEADPRVFSSIDLGSGLLTKPLTSSPGVSAFGFSKATWTQYETPWPGDPAGATPDADNDYDATYTFAQAVCSLSANDTTVEQVLAQYDSSATWDTDVWNRALSFGMNPDGSSQGDGTGGSPSPPSAPGAPPPPGDTTYPIYEPPGETFDGSGAALVAAAETQLGVPYVWGGTTPGEALDCSGLVVVSLQAIGFNIIGSYRTSQEQSTLGTEVAPADVRAGDLLLMPGDDGGEVVPLGHIGIAISDTQMIEAPYTGQVVRIAPIPWSSIETARRILASP